MAHEESHKFSVGCYVVRDLDFAKPECREWYWSQAKTLFDSGMAGWWNDEADRDVATPATSKAANSAAKAGHSFESF